MIDVSATSISNMIIHKVGHQGRLEKNHFSNMVFKPDEKISLALIDYFLKPFKASTETFHFDHHMDIKMNEVYACCNNIFEKENFILNSLNIVTHLYNQSKHPNIKSGEVFIVHYDDIVFEDKILDAVGFFKSERK